MDGLTELLTFLRENLLLGDSNVGIAVRLALIIVLSAYWGLIPL
jgi:hypothetical protein